MTGARLNSVVVVPTARESSVLGFLDAWSEEPADATILIVEDSPERTFTAPGENVRHFAWCDIDADLGDNSWIIPRQTGCIRSYGCWVASQMRPDMIVALDDDVRPDPAHQGFLGAHWARLQTATDPAWTSTLNESWPRGLPYFATDRHAPVILNHGLWNGVPDFDAPTQLVSSRVPVSADWIDQTIPRGCYFPMCSMNVAWRPAFTPAMYFLLMGPEYPFDRFGDIWGGILAKRVADHLGFAVNSGSPAVLHKRASSVFTNLEEGVTGPGGQRDVLAGGRLGGFDRGLRRRRIRATGRPPRAGGGVRVDPQCHADLGGDVRRCRGMSLRLETASPPRPRPCLLILTPDFPPDRGGIQTLVYELARTITAFDVEILAVDRPGAETLGSPERVARHDRTAGLGTAWKAQVAGLERRGPSLRGPRSTGRHAERPCGHLACCRGASTASGDALRPGTSTARRSCIAPAYAEWGAMGADTVVAISAYTASLIAATGACHQTCM